MQLSSKLTLLNVAGPATLSAGDITGANDVVLKSSNAAPGTQTTRTATQMSGDHGGSLAPYRLRITNIGAGTFTLAAGSGVTLTGTMTIATNTWRDFVVTFASASALTIESVGVGTYS